jgi:hypothetical protein
VPRLHAPPGVEDQNIRACYGGRDIPVGTLAAIIKQAGVSVEDWLAL